MNRVSTFLRVCLWFIVIFFVAMNDVDAQSPGRIANALGIKGDISTIQIDDFSDAQLIEWIEKGHAEGYSDNEIFSLLELSELPPLQVTKLRLRYAEIERKAKEFESTNVGAGEILEETLKSTETSKLNDFPVQDNTFENDSISFVYGKSMFKDGSIGFFEKTIDKTAPENYILGVGDVISLNIWGDSDFSGSYTIEKWGGISDSKIDRIYLRGLTFEKAKSLLLARFGRRYDKLNSSYEVSLSYSREVSISFVGEVDRPGTYNIPAVNSLFNSLSVCGGPSVNGTLRNIVVLRDGKKVHTLDVYKYLSNPLQQEDFYLENGDIVYVSVLKNVIEATGEFKRPGKYELLYQEGLNALLDYTGGYTSEAYLKNIQIKRIEQNKDLVIKGVNLDSLQQLGVNMPLFDGDVVTIVPINDEIVEYVDVLGSVNIPGRYDFVNGESVFDLIKRVNGLKEDAYLDLAYIVRSIGLRKDYIQISLSDSTDLNKDEYKLMNKDVVKVFSIYEFGDTHSVEVFGFVREPKTLLYSPSMTLYDAIVLSGGLKFDADIRVELSRVNAESGQGNSDFIDINIENGNIVNDKESQLTLKPFDRVFVRKKSFTLEDEIVTLSGEVKFPGEYALNRKDETISDLISRAGGLTNVAQQESAIFFRESGGIGEVILELQKALENPSSTYNYMLKGGDAITIPRVEYFVSLRGAIDYPIDSASTITAPWVPGKSARYYINKYGNGFSDNAFRKRTYVLQSNRKISRTSRVLFVKNYPTVQPGGIVNVIPKVPKNRNNVSKERIPISWNQVIKDVLTTATAVIPLVIVLVKN